MPPARFCRTCGTRHCWPMLILAMLALWAGGCTTFSPQGSLAEAKTEVAALAEPAPAASCTVEIRTSARRSQTVDVPISAQTRVQDVLDASRATSKFRNLDVVILRPTKNVAEPMLKLPCRFDVDNRQIGWETDYAILPGDRVVVREDTTSPFDRVMGAMLGPMFGSR